MSGTVYAVASGKGGVGKTTTTVNLGTALAMAGESVAIVDTDLGMANLAGFVSLNPESTTLHDVLADEADLEEATYELVDGMVAIPSAGELEEYAKSSPEGLGAVVAELRESHDRILLDVGAGVSHESVLPLGLADGVLLVSTPEPASVQDVKKTIELAERAEGRVLGIVITRTRPETDVSYDRIADQLDVTLIGTIPDDPLVRESLYAGRPVVVHDQESPAAQGYRRLAMTLLESEDLAEPDATRADGGDEE